MHAFKSLHYRKEIYEEIKLSVEDKNLKTVLTVLNSLNVGLISDIKTTAKDTIDIPEQSCNTKVNRDEYSATSNLHHIDIDKKREKLFSFASLTLILLSIAALFFEVYDDTYVPPFLRVILASYWLYSLAGIIVSKRGNDYWVSKLYFNVSK